MTSKGRRRLTGMAVAAAGIGLAAAGAVALERRLIRQARGKPDPERGIREIVAGTGGAVLRAFEEEDSNSEVRQASTYGVLRLDLHPGSYDWEFIPIEGGTFTDRGSGTCH